MCPQGQDNESSDQLISLLSSSEDWLVARILDYAKKRGYAAYSSTLERPWRDSISKFSSSIVGLLQQSEQTMDLTYQGGAEFDVVAPFALDEARKHRKFGVPLGQFLGLTKYYRQTYIDRILGQLEVPHQQAWARKFIDSYFDNAEVAICSEWLAVEESVRQIEADEKSRTLLNEKNQYLTILESLQEAVFVTDETGKIENLNYVAASLFDRNAIPGSGYYGQSDYEHINPHIAEIVARGDSSNRFEIALETTSGLRDFEVKTGPILDISEKFIGNVIVLSDVTEYKRALREANAASLAKSRFLATMSHEIRTPINGVIGIGSLLTSDGMTDTDREYVSALLSSGNLLLQLVNDVLDYSRAEQEPLSVNLEEFHLYTALQTVMDATRILAENKGIELSLHLDDSLPDSTVGDRVKIQRILINFVTNALRHTRSGAVSVKLEDKGHDACFRLSVQDTGSGIPESIRDTLFEPFTQHMQAEQLPTRGIGLGLAICKQLATAMDGNVGFATTLGEGSTFWLDFPKVAGAQPAGYGPASDVEIPALPILKVLVADDNQTNRLVVEGILGRDGHEVVSVVSGEAALGALSNEPFDLILMDIRMEGMGGLKAIQHIRSLDNAERASVPVLVITADSSATLNTGYCGRQADEVLEKPFNPDQLMQAIKSTLHNASAFQQRPAVPANSRLIDRSVVQRYRRDLGDERARLIVSAFKKGAESSADDILDAARQTDRASIYNLAHALKGSADTVGLTRLSRLADEAQRQAPELDAAALSGLCHALVDEIRTALAELKTLDD